MSKAATAVNIALSIANDNAHGYDQGSRWGPDYDCSSLVITAWQNAGVPVKSRGATYTGNMRRIFLACGFVDVTASVNLGSGAGMLAGDVLLNETRHTAMYIGGGQIVHARGNENGGATGGMSGDQTGREICTQGYYNCPWDCVLRYQESGGSSGSGTTPTTPSTPAASAPVSGADADGYYTVRAGDSLWAIAERELGSGARYREIMTENKMTSTLLHVGDRLKIPGKGTEHPAEPATDTPSSPANTQTGSSNTQPSVGSESDALDDGYYTVKNGDTLWGIAHKYLGSGLRWKEIQKANGLNTIIIHVGDRLKIPEK